MQLLDPNQRHHPSAPFLQVLGLAESTNVAVELNQVSLPTSSRQWLSCQVGQARDEVLSVCTDAASLQLVDRHGSCHGA